MKEKAWIRSHLFFDGPAHLTAGRYDQIDNFQAASGTNGTFIDLPTANAATTGFVDIAGGVFVYTPSTDGSGFADILIHGNIDAATVKAQTTFGL